MPESSLLIELAECLRTPSHERRSRLQHLRRLALKEGVVRIAALCLHALSELEYDLDKRAKLQTRCIAEHPSSLGFRSLAATEIARGHFEHARKAYACALEHASKTDRARLAESMQTIDAALAGNAREMALLFRMRAQVETDLAILGARERRHDPYRRLERVRRQALRAGQQELAMLILSGLVAVAADQKDRIRQVRFAKRLVAEAPSASSLQLLGAALEAAGNIRSAYRTYLQSLRVASETGDKSVAQLLERKLKAMRDGAIPRPHQGRNLQ